MAALNLKRKKIPLILSSKTLFRKILINRKKKFMRELASWIFYIHVYKMIVDGWIYHELLILKFGFFQTLLIGIR